MAQLGAMRALLEAGVFQAIPKGGQSMSAQEISAKTGVHQQLIGKDSVMLLPGSDRSSWPDSEIDACCHAGGTFP